MTTPNDGGSAFPQHGWTSDPKVLERMKNQGGMTLRDYFAAKAIRIWLEESKLESPFVDVDEDYIAKKAYKMADAMLKARESKPESEIEAHCAEPGCGKPIRKGEGRFNYSPLDVYCSNHGKTGEGLS